MRRLIPALLLAALLYVATPAQAQLRANLPDRNAPAEVYATPAGISIGELFSSQNLRFNHSYELSYSSFGSQSLGLGVYTTSIGWQPSQRLAARVDVGVAHSPFGSDGIRSQLGFTSDQPAQLFLRNAEIAYRPTDSMVFHLSVQQSPFGSYASPYGGNGYGSYGTFGTGGNHMRASFGTGTDALFWKGGGR
jgi:hypothetical protein